MNKIYFTLILFLAVSCESNKKQEPTKSAIMNENHGVVTSASPEATKAGMIILEKGGNAADAAIAVQFALGVTEPAMSGLGGGTQVILALPGEIPISLNGASISPANTPENAQKSDLTFHKRSTIPSTVKVMEYLYNHFGSGNVSWEELLEPAIYYAEKGFAVGKFRHKVYKFIQSQLNESPHHTEMFLMPDGGIPAPGDTLKQPILAKTLRRLAEYGADDFYHGEIAKEIAADMLENRGWITLEDLNHFPDPVELEPVTTKFREYDVYSQPPPCGGWTALLALNIMENFSTEDLQPGSQSRFENVLTSLHLAHEARRLNPVHNEQDLIDRLDKGYAKDLLEKFNPVVNDQEDESQSGETTHYSVTDKNGFAIGITSSINAYFGCRAASPKLGFLYNSYMDDFETNSPEHPFQIGPGKMNYSSMSPTIVQKDGETQLIMGSPGSARIISSVAQLIQLWADTNDSIQKIVAYPRLHASNGNFYYENLSISPDWTLFLKEKGLKASFPNYNLYSNGLNAYFGGVHAISFEKNKWTGAYDPRRDGLSLEK